MHHLQVTTDEGSLRELLEASARRGSAVIAIYVPQRERIDEVSALLFSHGARLAKYVGNWSVEDLFPPIKEERAVWREIRASWINPSSKPLPFFKTICIRVPQNQLNPFAGTSA